MTAITSFDHAAHLVAIGEAEAADARTSQEAIYLQYAFEARLQELGNCRSCDAIEEGKWLTSQLDALNCDWGEPESPECQWHLY